MKVRIINGREAWWYEKLIGEVFSVTQDRKHDDLFQTYRPILGTGPMMMHHIRKEDTEIIASNPKK